MSKTNNSNLITQLSETTVLTGDIHVANDLRVAGKIIGNINCEAHLVILDGAEIEGNILSQSITHNGLITGNIECLGQCVLEPNCKLKGDIKTKSLVINEGATFEGSCQMNPGSSTSKSATSKKGSL